MRPIDTALAVFVAVAWGLNFLFAKWALAEFPPVLAMALRFSLVALLLVPFVRAPWADLRRLAALSFTLGCVHFSLMFSGVAGLDAGLASIVAQSQVPFTALLSAVFLKDYPGWRQWLGMGLAFFGIWLAAGEPRAGGDAWHIALVLMGTFVWAGANFQMKALGHVDGFAINAYVGLFAAPQLLVLSFATESGQIDALRNAGFAAWLGIAYMACVVTIVTYWIWYRLLRRYEVNRVIPYSLLVPVFGVLAGALWMGDPLGWPTVAGALATVAGVAILTFPRRARPVRAP
jgi:O-acetylserine/cysteine efflux transporter